jgi:hypothetical protein
LAEIEGPHHSLRGRNHRRPSPALWRRYRLASVRQLTLRPAQSGVAITSVRTCHPYEGLCRNPPFLVRNVPAVPAVCQLSFERDYTARSGVEATLRLRAVSVAQSSQWPWKIPRSGRTAYIGRDDDARRPNPYHALQKTLRAPSPRTRFTATANGAAPASSASPRHLIREVLPVLPVTLRRRCVRGTTWGRGGCPAPGAPTA